VATTTLEGEGYEAVSTRKIASRLEPSEREIAMALRDLST
jgi:hypothetical protein